MIMRWSLACFCKNDFFTLAMKAEVKSAKGFQCDKIFINEKALVSSDASTPSQISLCS